MTDQWICKRCLHITSTKSNLLSHLRNKKPCPVEENEGGIDIQVQSYIDELLTPKQPKNYACPHCDSRFSYNQSMNKHIRGCKNNPANNISSTQEDTNIINDNSTKSDKDELSSLQETIKEQRELIQFLRKEIEILKSNNINITFNITTEVPVKQYKKKNISHAVKIKCWNTHVGELVPKVKCLCCNNVDITQHNFHCGHVIAECNGGSYEMNNLLPICNVCNSSMGSMNMNDFKTMYGFTSE
jgi:hypothetical protein